MIILTGTLLIVLALIAMFWVVVAHEHAPSAADVAVAYELARARGDWSTVFDLVGVELRDESDRAHFVGARRTAGAGSDNHVEIESETVATEGALVVTAVVSPTGTTRHALQCERRHGRWVVIADTPALAQAPRSN